MEVIDHLVYVLNIDLRKIAIKRNRNFNNPIGVSPNTSEFTDNIRGNLSPSENHGFPSGRSCAFYTVASEWQTAWRVHDEHYGV